MTEPGLYGIELCYNCFTGTKHTKVVGYEVNYGKDFVELVIIDDEGFGEYYTFTPEEMQRLSDTIILVLMELKL